MTENTTTTDNSLDPTTDSTPSRPRRRLAALMTGALVASVGLGVLAPAANASVVSSVAATSVMQMAPAAPSPSLSLSSTPGSGVINASGSGFASGATIRLDVFYPTTGDLKIGAAQVTATTTRYIYNPITLQRTTLQGGSFSASITVPSSEFRNCWNGDVFYVRAVQITPDVETSFQAVNVHWATIC